MKYLADHFTKKPWGFEYLIGNGGMTALWCLTIKRDISTSFHCHPLKRTGYVVLEGAVRVEFLSDQRILYSGDFINIRPGLFHRTTSMTDLAIVLEVESPDHKQDLLRLEDSSGRESSVIELPSRSIDVPPHLPFSKEFHDIFNLDTEVLLNGFSISKISYPSLEQVRLEGSGKDFMMILDGILFTNHTYPLVEAQRLLGAGDVISFKNFMKLKHLFSELTSPLTAIRFRVP